MFEASEDSFELCVPIEDWRMGERCVHTTVLPFYLSLTMNLWFLCVCVSVRRMDFPFRYLYWLCRSLFTILFSYLYHRFSLFCCDVYFKYCFCYSVSKSALVSPPAVERGLIFTRYTHNKRHKCKGKRCMCAFNCTCVRSALPLTLVYDFMNVISIFF